MLFRNPTKVGRGCIISPAKYPTKPKVLDPNPVVKPIDYRFATPEQSAVIRQKYISLGLIKP